ncbi:MAG TPA: HAD-IIA family hydrolase, partial [Actinomycetota bacterium]|nr:HAD-IIA family hydrolase [Actinomycetota bacterium]
MRPAERYEAFLLDLDGVVYRGTEALPGAAEAITELKHAGRRVLFLTNNSARTAAQVADRLVAMGIDAAPEDVLTSAQATAAMIAADARRSGRPATAFVVGEEGLDGALRDAGIDTRDGEAPGYVVVGWDRGIDFGKLRRASVLVRSGATLVASNADATYPAPGGELWPGAGSLLAAVETASGRRADVVGKPHRPMFDAAVERVATRDALVVGDRLETDVAGAVGAGLDAAFVLSGAGTLADLPDHEAQPHLVLRNLAAVLDERCDARLRRARPEDADAVGSLLEAA